MDYAQVLLKLRAKTGWNQAALAENIGVSQSLVSAIERGARMASNTISIKIRTLLEQHGVTEEVTDILQQADDIYEYKNPRGTTIVHSSGATAIETPRAEIEYLKSDLARKNQTIDHLNRYIALLEEKLSNSAAPPRDRPAPPPSSAVV